MTRRMGQYVVDYEHWLTDVKAALESVNRATPQ